MSACGLVTFTVTEQIGPLGTVAKLPADYREAAFDFTCWLADGEFVTSVAQHGVVANPVVSEITCSDSGTVGSWSLAFNCSGAASAHVPHAATGGSDTTPLTVIDTHVGPDGKQATVVIGQGTAGLTYGVSFLATVAPSLRRKAVDLLVCVGTPMVDFGALPTPPPPPPYQFVTGSATLPLGSTGSIFINNTTNTAINITLPPLPDINQTLVIKDVTGNAGTYPITIIAYAGTIDGQPNVVLSYNYAWVELTFTGTQWVQV